MFEALSYSCMTPCLHPTRICGARGLATHAQLWLLSLSDNLTPRVEGAAEDPGAQQMQQKKKNLWRCKRARWRGGGEEVCGGGRRTRGLKSVLSHALNTWAARFSDIV